MQTNLSFFLQVQDVFVDDKESAIDTYTKEDIE